MEIWKKEERDQVIPIFFQYILDLDGIIPFSRESIGKSFGESDSPHPSELKFRTMHSRSTVVTSILVFNDKKFRLKHCMLPLHWDPYVRTHPITIIDF